ncbi:MAG TPA: hypothetical protein VIK91_21050, partial [Nannocystis sp.]
AWDRERIEAELAELEDLARERARREALGAAAVRLGVAVEDLPPAEREAAEDAAKLSADDLEAARATHPVRRYLAGETRYQLDALDQGPRGPACAQDYLRPGVEPTVFVLRRVPLRERALIEVDRDPFSRWVRWVKAGVTRIATGAEVLWEAKEPGDVLPDAWIEALGDAHGGPAVNLITLAGACSRYSGPLTEAEGKR